MCSRHWDNGRLIGKLNLVLSQPAHRTTQREGSFLKKKAMPILSKNNTPVKAVVPRHPNRMTQWSKGLFCIILIGEILKNLIANVFNVYYMYCKKEPY